MEQLANKEINIYDALRAMRKLSSQNIPFRIGFISCDRSKQKSSGYIELDRVLLSAGLPKKKSRYANNLIAYEDTETGDKKHFWLPLLMKFNGIKITHDRVYR
ncbi:hypothetical protein [Riemerella columbina]|uniref:hypothetical protein n=1 Tax=Riemerella columbina TaxID=103810 RepID=UPI00038265CA|nr:hypothetical protein [Riemerella columbina]